MSFREQLPTGCPPQDALPINRPKEVFRLVRSVPPTDEDFRSQRAERPTAKFRVCECVARGLSVFEEREACFEYMKLPNLKGTSVCRVNLQPGAGFIKPTGSNQAHRTWWPVADFNILDHAEVDAS